MGCVCYMQVWKTAFETSNRFLGTDREGWVTDISNKGAAELVLLPLISPARARL